MLQCVMDDFAKCLKEFITAEGGTFTAFCLQNVNSLCMKFNFQDLCYLLMCKFALFSQLNRIYSQIKIVGFLCQTRNITHSLTLRFYVTRVDK
jgi:hypothetical protein